MVYEYYLIPLLLWMVSIAIMDFKYRKVKNILIIIGFVYILAIDISLSKNSIFSHVYGALLATVFLLIFYALKMMGAGDVKFGFVMGFFWSASFDLLWVSVIASLAAMCHSVIYLTANGGNIYLEKLSAIFGARFKSLKNLLNRPINASIPFAGYMAMSSIFWMLYTSQP